MFWKVKPISPAKGFEHVKGYAGFAAGRPRACREHVQLMPKMCQFPVAAQFKDLLHLKWCFFIFFPLISNPSISDLLIKNPVFPMISHLEMSDFQWIYPSKMVDA